MDVRMGGMNGLETLRRIRETNAKLPVIMMTAYGTTQTAIEAMKLGAADFIEKPFEDEKLLTMINAALNNAEASSRRDGKALEIVELMRSLTARERDVLDGLVAGRSNKDIGRDLDISPRTVEIYRANLMKKMQATSLSELVRIAIKAGLS